MISTVHDDLRRSSPVRGVNVIYILRNGIPGKKKDKKKRIVETYRFILRVPFLELLASSRLRKRDWEHRTNANQSMPGVSDLTPPHNDSRDETTRVVMTPNSQATARASGKHQQEKIGGHPCRRHVFSAIFLFFFPIRLFIDNIRDEHPQRPTANRLTTGD